MRKKLLAGLGIIAFLIISGLTATAIINNKKENTPLPHVRLGVSTQPANGLLWVAIDQKFFLNEGLDVEIKEFTAGKLALQAMLGGSLDLVSPAEFPVVLASLSGENLSILTKINETQGGFPMILREEGDKFDPEIYFSKKRKIATLVGSGAEFFTQDFLQKYKIDPKQYEIINMKPEDLPIALANKSVDGIAIFEPFAHFAKERTGEDNLFVIYNKDLYSETIVLTGKTDWIKSHNEEAKKFVSALQKTYEYIKNNPESAMASIALHTKLDAETVKNIWPTFSYQLGLEKKLITTMQAEANWAKETGKSTVGAEAIDFQKIFYLEPLKSVAPQTVVL